MTELLGTQPQAGQPYLETKAPRRPHENGTLRIISVKNGIPIVARFPDDVEQNRKEKPDA